jgi:hypothetical protein
MAAQFTLISGRARSALRAWMARATSSFPVPFSPVISTVLLDVATGCAHRRTSWIARLRPTIP